MFFVLAKAALKICAGQKKLQIVLNSEKEIGLLFVLPVTKNIVTLRCGFLLFEKNKVKSQVLVIDIIVNALKLKFS